MLTTTAPPPADMAPTPNETPARVRVAKMKERLERQGGKRTSISLPGKTVEQIARYMAAHPGLKQNDVLVLAVAELVRDKSGGPAEG